MLGLLCISSCSDDMHDEFSEDCPLSFAVSASWGEGRSLTTRSISDDILQASGSSNIDITSENFPEQVVVAVVRGEIPLLEPFEITKSNETCDSDLGYYMYESTKTVTYNIYKERDFDFYAWTNLDTDPSPKASTSVGLPMLWKNIPTFGFCDYLYSRKAPVHIIADDVDKDKKSGHVLFDLKHYTAMLRLFYGYSTEYAKVRNIVLRKVKINRLNSAGTKKVSSCDLDDRTRFTTIDGAPGFRLSTESAAFGYVYVNPDSVSVTTKLSLECTYDIYDDEAFDSDGKPVAEDISTHRTRKDVTAVSSAFTLKSASITKFESGKYYDLNVTINPDYLYVLSEHDDKPVTVQ